MLVKTVSHGIGGVPSAYPNLGVGTYQRTVVWKGPQKADFIRSVLKGFPTGVIVLNTISEKGDEQSASHDIIDGQQRLTTLYEFLENPLVYVIDWVPKAPTDPEPNAIQDVRAEFDALYRQLKPVKAGYFPKGMKTPDARRKLSADAGQELRKKRSGVDIDSRFGPLVEKAHKFYLAVTKNEIVVQELQDMPTHDAELLYELINTRGTEVLWWELLKVDPAYAHQVYTSTSGYKTTHDGLVARTSKLYRAGKLPAHPTKNDSFWDALFALGEFYHLLFAGEAPAKASGLVRRSDRKLKIDGLGFRLVSAFLSHEVNRVAINELFDDYSEEDVRRAIDALIDTGEILFSSAPNFDLFKKYSRFGADVIPAGPLVGVIIASSKFVALNKQSGMGITLTENDTTNLRCLAEELFRELLCTQKWAGSGDSKLKAWLDSHFLPVARKRAPRSPPPPSAPYPGKLLTAASTYDKDTWIEFINTLKPTGSRSVDKRSMLLCFWLQYLFDSKAPGALPQGEVAFDHIVSHQATPGSTTSHPLNYAAITEDLNAKKGKKSYLQWNPAGKEAASYRLCVLENLDFEIGGKSAEQDFLQYADHAQIGKLVSERKKVAEYGLGVLLPHWTSNGD